MLSAPGFGLAAWKGDSECISQVWISCSGRLVS
jgi:hypothetical protein